MKTLTDAIAAAKTSVKTEAEVTVAAKALNDAVDTFKKAVKTGTYEEKEETGCKHKPDKIDAKAATTEKEGNIEHYICSKCGKYFSDANGTKEITKESVVIPKLTPEDPTDPDEDEDETKPTEPEKDEEKPESDTPVTGENFPMILLGTLMLISLAGVAVLLWSKCSMTGKYIK